MDVRSVEAGESGRIYREATGESVRARLSSWARVSVHTSYSLPSNLSKLVPRRETGQVTVNKMRNRFLRSRLFTSIRPITWISYRLPALISKVLEATRRTPSGLSLAPPILRSQESNGTQTLAPSPIRNSNGRSDSSVGECQRKSTRFELLEKEELGRHLRHALSISAFQIPDEGGRE